MDDLDRLFRRVVHNVRAAYPELLTQPFEVAQLYQQVVPYRLNRRELAVETVEEYELALMQLISGARGYLTGDADMQRALRDELESLNPDLSAYRGYATSRIALSADAVRAIDQQPMTPAGARTATVATAAEAALASRATERIATSATKTPPAARVVAAPPKPAAAAAPKPAAAVPQKPPAKPSAAMPSPSSPSAIPSAAKKTDGGGGSDAHATTCRYCAGDLPEGKNIVFCPYCGHDLTVQHCPACNTELEIGWRFCITCGRQVS